MHATVGIRTSRARAAGYVLCSVTETLCYMLTERTSSPDLSPLVVHCRKYIRAEFVKFLGEPADDGVYGVRFCRLSRAARESRIRLRKLPIVFALNALIVPFTWTRSPIFLMPISLRTAWSHLTRLLPVTLFAEDHVRMIQRDHSKN